MRYAPLQASCSAASEDCISTDVSLLIRKDDICRALDEDEAKLSMDRGRGVEGGRKSGGMGVPLPSSGCKGYFRVALQLRTFPRLTELTLTGFKMAGVHNGTWKALTVKRMLVVVVRSCLLLPAVLSFSREICDFPPDQPRMWQMLPGRVFFLIESRSSSLNEVIALSLALVTVHATSCWMLP